MKKTLMVFPLQEELDAFLSYFSGEKADYRLLGKLPIVTLLERQLTLSVGGTGKTQFAIQLQHLIDMEPEWEWVVCAGTAGALVKGIDVGDVVVGMSTIEHDYKNLFVVKPRPMFEAPRDLIYELRQYTVEGFRVHFGIIASGDEDIIDETRREALRRETMASAVAWEGAGAARTCRFNKLPFTEIRGITDLAGESAPSDFLQNTEMVMRNMAKWFSLLE